LVKHYPVSIHGRRHTIRSVDGVSFSIREGEVFGLVGESGCGKTTIARLLTRLTLPTSGSIRIDGRDVVAMQGEELRRMRRTIQLVFQNPYAALDPRMRIGTSMEAPLAQHGLGNRNTRRECVLEMLDDVGLDASFYHRHPAECSGGQLQRVVIGRALLLRPWLLVCDEPTAALDASMRTQILNLLQRLKQRFTLTIVMISHDLRMMRYLCDRIAVMYLGQFLEVADRGELFRSPRHPYTQTLIAAGMIERTGLDHVDELLRGDLPSPVNPPPACRLHTRCALATQLCTAEAPELERVGAHHEVRCHHWQRLASDASGMSILHDANERQIQRGREAWVERH
jgi:peptide/nickel transport system ATP-binding protein